MWRMGEWLCESCKEWVTREHLCNLYASEPPSTESSYIIFDFEATQDTVAQCEKGYCPSSNSSNDKQDQRYVHCKKAWSGRQRHVPNFVIAQTACQVPITRLSTCNICGSRCKKCSPYDQKSKTYLHKPYPATCGFREILCKGDSTMDDFGKWLFQDNHRNAIVLAHNLRSPARLFAQKHHKARQDSLRWYKNNVHADRKRVPHENFGFD